MTRNRSLYALALPALTLALWAVTTPSASGQAASYYSPSPVQTKVIKTDPCDVSSVQTARAVVGQFSPDLRLDTVVLLEGETVFAYGVGFYDAVSCFANVVPGRGTTAADIATLPGSGAPATDALLMVSSRGLERWELDPTEFWSVTTPLTSWSDMTRIHVGDVDGSGPSVVGCALGSATEVRIVADPWVDPFSESSVDFLTTIHDFILLDWDGDGDLDIAAITASGLDIRTSGGVPLDFIAGAAAPGDVLLALDYPFPGADRLVRIYSLPSGLSELEVIYDSAPDPVTELAVPLPVGPVSGGASEDLNGDSYADLVLTTDNNNQLLVVTNQGGSGPTFIPPDSSSEISLGSGGNISMTSTPALGDCDNDGDVEIVFPRDTTNGSRLTVLRSSLESALSKRPTVIGGSYLYDPDPAVRELTITFDVQQNTEPMVDPDALQVVVWQHPAYNAEGVPTSIQHGFIYLQGTSYGQFGQSLAINFPALEHLPNSVTSFEIREVKLGSSGEVLEAGPSWCWSVIHSAYADLLKGFYRGFEPYFTLTNLGAESGNVIATVVPFDDVPCFQDDLWVFDDQGPDISVGNP